MYVHANGRTNHYGFDSNQLVLLPLGLILKIQSYYVVRTNGSNLLNTLVECWNTLLILCHKMRQQAEVIMAGVCDSHLSALGVNCDCREL